MRELPPHSGACRHSKDARVRIDGRSIFLSYPNGNWGFNPLTWQLLFVFGAWCLLSLRLVSISGGHAVRLL